MIDLDYLAAMLAEHKYQGASSVWCGCGKKSRIPRGVSVAAHHRAHVAKILAAEFEARLDAERQWAAEAALWPRYCGITTTERLAARNWLARATGAE